MARFFFSFSSATSFLVILAVILAVSWWPAKVLGGGEEIGFFPVKKGCDGSIAECLEEEFEMDSEISRRILATTKYISYGALQRNTVPCSRRGASYYNCKTGAQANPYNRGCSAITRCRS
ncbi:protein RALF-like 33 [Morus notabilis]|uniref:protein RALF-like 33 n=1 Tax=Morus notabilis TaxID=981085 RepID=UPI000CED006A|nr:protein RALF-like 33 [Morus notabilis]